MSEMLKGYITGGFAAYRDLAKQSVRRRWRKMNLHEKCDACRSLGVMDIVAKDQEWFSSEKSKSSWLRRSKEFSQNHIVRPEDCYGEYVFVESPRDIIWMLSRHAMNVSLACQYYNFLDKVQNYEIMPDDQKEKYAKEIEQDSKRVTAKVKSFAFILKVKQARKNMKMLRSRVKTNLLSR